MSNTLARMVDRFLGKRKQTREALAKACEGVLANAATSRRSIHFCAGNFESLEGRVLLAADTLQVNGSQILNSVTDNFLGVNYVAFWDSNQGDAGSAQALKNAGVQVLRFGGGEPANWYNWADPLYKNWSSTTPASLATFAQTVGAQLLLQTNPTTNGDNNPSAASAAGWVSDMKSLGSQAPYWEIGNENDGAGNGGATAVNSNYDWSKYQSYLNTWNAQATAMHLADPSIKIYGNAGTNDYYWWQLHSLDMFLNKTGNRFGSGQVDGVSVHYYPTVPTNATFAQVEANAQTIPARIAAITAMTAAQDTRNLPIAITETSAANGTSAGPIVNEMGAALANADLIAQYKADGVQQVDWFGAIHQVNSNWGILYAGGSDGTLDQASPQYWILPLLSHMGNIALGESGITNASTGLNAYATQSANGNYQELLINKDSVAHTVTVGFNGFDPTGHNVNIYSLAGATGAATDTSILYNGVVNPNDASAAGLPPPTTVTATVSTYQTVIPAYSIQMLDFQVNNSTLLPVTRISSPGNTDKIDAGSKINLGADAISSAGDGIASVKFYANGTLVGTSTTGTYNNFTAAWNNVAAGTYTITSVATDNNGAASTSAPITVTVTTRLPFTTAPTITNTASTTIAAANFDQGGDGFGYHWLGGAASTYRPSDTVNLVTSSDTDGGYDVTNAQNSDWLDYSINVTNAGVYSISARVADSVIGGQFHFQIDNANVGTTLTTPYTGGTNKYLTIGINGVNLTAGTHVLRVAMDSSVPATNGLTGIFHEFYISPNSVSSAIPAAPTLAGIPSDAHANLSWNLVVGATSYNLYRGTSAGSLALYQTGLTTPAYTDSGLTDGTTYFYQVTAVNTGGESVQSNQIPLTPQISIPAPWVAADVGAPALAGYSNYAGGTFTVNGAGSDIWNTADQFQFVYQPMTGDATIIAHVASQTNTGAWAKAGVMIRQSLATGAVNANMMLDPSGWAMMADRTTLNGGTTNANTGTSGYYVPNWIKLVRSGSTFTGYFSTDGVTWLQAGTLSATITMTGTVYVGLTVCSTNTGALSTVVFDHVSVAGTQVLPGAPTLNTATASSNQVALTWTPVPGANSYNIYRSNATGTETLYQSGVTNPWYTDLGVSGGSTYYYEITAVNTIGESAKSNEKSVAVSGSTLGTPVAQASGAVRQINLSWGTVAGASSYNIYRGSTSGSEALYKSGLTTLSYPDTGLGNGATYYYQVTAVSGGTESAKSTEVSASTTALPIAPASLQATGGVRQVSLTWGTVAGATSYSVYQSTTTGTETLLISGLTSASYVSGGLANGTQYFYKVTATNAAGEGAQSTESSTSTTALPVPPANLQATGGVRQVSLTWNTVAGATSYSVYRSTSAGAETLLIGGLTNASYVSGGLANGTQYYYKVTATNAAGEGTLSGEANATTTALPAQLTGLQATGGAGQIALTWNAVTGASSYNVYRSSTTGAETLWKSGILTASYTDLSLPAGTTYFYKVSAVNPAGEGALSSESSTATTSLPAQPTGLQATGGVRQISLVWNPVNGATSYSVYCSSTSSGETFLIGGLTNANYVDSGLANGATWYYKVTATNLAGEGAQSSESFATTTALPAQPSVQATGGVRQVSLAWAAIAGASSYNIYRATSSGGETLLTNVGTAGYVDPSLSNGATYYYQVSAVGAAGEGALSIETSAATTALPPVPTGLQAIGGVRQIALNWTGISGTTYSVYRASTSGAETLLISGLTSATFTDSGLTNGATWYYKVTATNAAGEGLLSSEVFAATTALPPTPLNPTATPGNNQVSLAWTAVSGASSYTVYRSTATGTETLLQANIGTNSYVDGSAVNGTKYYYKISATNAAGEGALSGEVSATPVAVPNVPSGVVAFAGSNAISLSWAAATGATTYNVWRSTISGSEVLLYTGAAVPSFVDNNVPTGTAYFYKIVAVNSVGQSGLSAEVSATALAGGTLPAGGTDGDIGAPAKTGSANYNGGTYTISGGGSDIGGKTDQFNYASESFTGDGTLIARVEGVQDTNASAKAGVMFRTSTAANSAYVDLVAMPGQSVSMGFRKTTGASATANTKSGINTPVWLKIVKSGNLYTGYYSTDGVTWTYIASETISLGTTITAGLAVTSHNTAATSTATFANVSITNKPAAGVTLLSNNFNTADISAWTPASGTWAAQNQAYAKTSATDAGMSFAGSQSWQDYSIQAQVNTASTAGGIGIIARAIDATHFYALKLTTVSGVTKWVLSKTNGATVTTLASGNYIFAANTNYTLKLTATGNKLTAAISTNGGTTFAALGSATDATYSFGQVGLCETGTTGVFDNIVVTTV